ncbi:MAG: outer membrane beta-barrel protein [Chitinivibrionales bacterium]|nr:outer membrane beta-barrel protein [Chitinivibrionales bacterium]
MSNIYIANLMPFGEILLSICRGECMNKNAFYHLLILALLMNTFSLSATDDFKWRIGPSAGLNVARMYGPGIQNIEDDYDVLPRMSGNCGLFVEYMPSKYIGTEIGIQVNGKGYTYHDPQYINGMDVKYKIRYKNGFVDFPFVIKPTLPFNNKKLYLMFGGAYGRIFIAKREVVADLSYSGQDTTVDIVDNDLLRYGVPFYVDTFGTQETVPYKDLYRLEDFALVVGIGYEGAPGSKENPVSLFF